ncbi:primosomal protein N' [Megamonas hypermegale]|uniref:primosomal protein N' n=1 Tax=Megamonas hypermegale TaxID=158847 RepID=UPI0026F1CA7F|nr:primosomal protein N' [Megamonas hypermegale]
MEKTADIYINIPVKSIAKPYTYLVPEQFDFLKAGCRVLVPFGGRLMEGFIIKIHDTSADLDTARLKAVKDVLDTQPWFTPNMYATAKWMADFYLCSLGETMRLFIPGKNSVKIRPVFNINETDLSTKKLAKLPAGQKQLLAYLKAYKNADLLTLRRSFGAGENFTADLEKLIAKNYVTRSYIYHSQAKKIYVEYAVLNAAVDETVLDTLKRKPAQKKALLYLNEIKESSAYDLKQRGISAATLNALAELGYIRLEKRQKLRDSYKNMLTAKAAKRTLTPEQQNALNIMKEKIGQGQKKFLLFGVTGSGKTQIYIETALKVRADGRQVLILVPEIVLTGQLVTSFKQYFADDVAVIHSKLSVNERNDTFWRIRTGQAGIVIGARSALFAPFDNLGLIVMDEEHDASYKQDESPRYHAHDVAEKMAQIYDAIFLLGSATPSLESFYKAQNGEYTLLTMRERIDNIPMPYIEGVDMREELKSGNRKILSRKLQELIEATLAKKQQLIIMLNRRGFSTFVMCRSCGHVIKCPQCNLPLVYHRRGVLQCHHCDITEPVPDVCPNCQSRYIKFFGSGTEKLEEELAQVFPQARIIRLDRDTTGRKFAHQDILKQFKAGLYDILLGTQMVAKGHDIPSVTGVGIISADSSLNLPDFRASERTFALITQTAGRAGRGHEQGHVVLQTYNLEHYAVQCGMKQDYLSFYQEEMQMRKILYYPPFCHLIKLTFQNEIEEKALKAASDLKTQAEQYFNNMNIKIMGPAPALVAKFKDIYRFNLLIKTDDLEIVNKFLRQKKIDTDKNITIDINPINTN